MLYYQGLQSLQFNQCQTDDEMKNAVSLLSQGFYYVIDV
nr:MAG TPA: hypothetical protein [Caudoviricetes sp.]